VVVYPFYSFFRAEDKIHDAKDSFYEEIEGVFSSILKYLIKTLFGNFNVKGGREDILKTTIGSKSLHEICNDNGVRVVNFAASKNLIAKSAKFPHRNIINFLRHLLMETHNQIHHILRA
jgi:hypothetical protein